jgi:hypothetical protein
MSQDISAMGFKVTKLCAANGFFINSELRAQSFFGLLIRNKTWRPSEIQMTAFWQSSPCSLVETDRRFKGAYFSIIKTMLVTLTMEAVSVLK